MDMNFILYGISIGGLVIGLVRLAGEFGLVGRTADLVRGVGLGGAYLLVANAEALAAQFAWFEDAVVMGGGFLTIVLITMGYGPTVSKMARSVSAGIQKLGDTWR